MAMNVHAGCRDCAFEKCCLENEVVQNNDDVDGSTEH